MGNNLIQRIRSVFTSSKPQEITMVGLDGVGKTTILYLLKDKETVTTVPTIGFNIEDCVIGNTKLKIWDVGGQKKIRQIWSLYTESSNGLVYVFDISDEANFKLGADYLMKVMSEKNVPVLILINKIDLVQGGSSEVHERSKTIQSMCNFSTTKIPYKFVEITANPSDKNVEMAYITLLDAFSWLKNAINNS